MSTPNHTLTLNNGKLMPLVGHGLWKIPNDKVADHVYNAIKAGYRLFDSACGKISRGQQRRTTDTFQITGMKLKPVKVLQEH